MLPDTKNEASIDIKMRRVRTQKMKCVIMENTISGRKLRFADIYLFVRKVPVYRSTNGFHFYR